MAKGQGRGRPKKNKNRKKSIKPPMKPLMPFMKFYKYVWDIEGIKDKNPDLKLGAISKPGQGTRSVRKALTPWSIIVPVCLFQILA